MNTNTWVSRVAVLAAGAALALTPLAQAGASPAPDDAKQAPLHGTDSATAIAGEYIVVLTDDSTDARVQDVSAAATAAGATITRTYGHAIKGFAGTLPAEALAAVRASAGVEFVEADARVSVPPMPARPTDITEPDHRVQDVQPGATWGLDRLDKRPTYSLDGRYRYDSTGLGVTAYIIDTGIRRTHNDFEGRATSGFTSINDGNGTNDCNGHGTHVAGTVGSAEYGVAKEVDLVAVRVLDCAGSGSNAGVIDGVDWVTDVAPVKAVANMSLGGGPSRALDRAVKRSIEAGIPYALAAGNSADDACNYSPARMKAGITVGATSDWDGEAWFSNYGSCLDMYAPGEQITSAWNTSNSATNTIDGTSMAAPHVAGAIALYLELHPNATTGEVRSAIVGGASKGKVWFWFSSGSPNKLLFSRID